MSDELSSTQQELFSVWSTAKLNARVLGCLLPYGTYQKALAVRKGIPANLSDLQMQVATDIIGTGVDFKMFPATPASTAIYVALYIVDSMINDTKIEICKRKGCLWVDLDDLTEKDPYYNALTTVRKQINSAIAEAQRAPAE